MGLDFFNFNKPAIGGTTRKGRADVRITEKGKRKMQAGLLDELQFQIASIIKKFDQCNSDDVARNMSPPRNIDMIRTAMEDMLENGLIEKVG
jgi:septum formation topological specificity factor MinE